MFDKIWRDASRKQKVFILSIVASVLLFALQAIMYYGNGAKYLAKRIDGPDGKQKEELNVFLYILISCIPLILAAMYAGSM